MKELILAIALSTTGIGPSNVTRCFAPGSPTKELKKATAVFSGKVVRRDFVVEETAPGEIGWRVVMKIAVGRVWKGDIATEVTLYTSEVHLINGLTRIYGDHFKFDEGKQYLVYAFGELDRLSTDTCTRTREMSQADDDLKELGDGHAPKTRKAAVEDERNE